MSDWDFDRVVDIFDEVDEDVRRERMQAAAKRYGPFVGGAVVLIVGAVAAYTFWQQQQQNAAGEAGAAFLAAARAQQAGLAAGEAGKGEAFAELAASGPGGYSALARFKLAEALAASGDAAAAIEALNAVETTEAPARYKDLARLLALGLRSYTESAENLLPLVEPMAAPGEPWRWIAEEQAAMLEWKLGRLDAARARLKALGADLSAPQGLRARAAAALTALPEG